MIIKNKKYQLGVLFSALVLGFVFFQPSNFVLADESLASSSVASSVFNLDNNFVGQDRGLVALDNQVNLLLSASTLQKPTVLEVSYVANEITTPWRLERLSKIIQIDFKDSAVFNASSSYVLDLSYSQESTGFKQIYFYNRKTNTWNPLKSVDYPDKKVVEARLNLPFAQVAVFSNPDILLSGKASWYKYKTGDFSASPDFPKGSKLRVYNLDYKPGKNNKYVQFVDVVVNDWGPDREKHPDRVVDLSKEAFAKLASTGAGVLNVRVEPLSITAVKGSVLGVSIKAVDEPEVSAKSAIVINEKTGEVVFEKNASAVLPIASLSKMVAVKTYLDLQNVLDLNYSVAYKYADEEYNYKYCSKGESARVKLSDGDVVTVKDLIYSALVGSANNAVETLARMSGVSRDKFIATMNQKVVAWGAVNTKFLEPTGLSPANVSSAKDYAIIMKEVLKDPIIKDASSARQYYFKTANTKKAHTIYNTNPLVLAKPNFQITGSKTGYLHEAGYCLMTRAQKGGNSLIAVALGSSTRSQVASEIQDLVNYGLKQTDNKSLLAMK